MVIYYVLVNESMPGLVKIGKTTQSVEKRMKELSSPTGIASPFICAYAVAVGDYDIKDYEKLAHNAFNELRHAHNREFFKVPLQDAVSLMRMIPGIEVTPNILSTNHIETTPTRSEVSKRPSRSNGKHVNDKTTKNVRDNTIRTFFEDHLEIIPEEVTSTSDIYETYTARTGSRMHLIPFAKAFRQFIREFNSYKPPIQIHYLPPR